MLASLASVAKALVAAILAALTALGAYLVNDTGFGDITAGQWVFVAIAFVSTLAAVWGIPWKPVETP